MIAQQWQWTYRFPPYGGVETLSLALPVGRTVEFHVTSLDVIHSFWAYQLGVKADAVPGADNIAYSTPSRPARSRSAAPSCAGSGTVTWPPTDTWSRQAGSRRWIASARIANAPSTHYLPPYAKVYFPAPLERAG